MAYRLALDLGTSSIGLVAVRLDGDRQPAEIIYHACRIFAEPLDPSKKGGVGEPKKARRRKARLARKLIDRRSRRLKRIAALAELIGLAPSTVEADEGQSLHQLRSEAVTRAIPLPDLLRVLLRMAKRRGYSGGFKTKREDQEEGKVEGGISRLKEEMTKAKCDYLGQYLYHRFQKGETLKLKEAGLYADREMIEAEFDHIWAIQSQHHAVLNDNHNGETLRKIFHQAIFYQRPLKSVAGMVGNCALEPSLPRAPMSQPTAQAFRIEKQLSDLRWGGGRRAELTAAQRDVIRGLLGEKKEVSFTAVYKALEKAGCSDDRGRTLNFDRASRPALRGDSTVATFDKLGFLGAWRALPVGAQVSTLNFLADLGSPQEVDRPDWQNQYRRKDGARREFNPEMVTFINKWVESGKFDRLSKMGFDGGRAAYSIKALNKLTEWLRAPWWPGDWKGDKTVSEDNAIRICYPDSARMNKASQRKLEPHAPTGNIVVDVALRQLWYQANACIEKLGEPPAEVIVELTRDMGLGVKRRNEIEDRINKNRRNRQHAADELAKNGESVTDRNIFRYLLWQQQETSCPYCETRIGLNEAVSGGASNVEHIVPRSLTRVGRQRDHLVLAHRRCNDEKGDRTPWQAWGKDPDRWTQIEAHAKALEKKKLFTKARLLTIKDYESEVMDDAAIEGFSERQFHESSWIAKLAAQWLCAVCPSVAVSRGELTAFLRRTWRLDTVIPEVRYEENLPVLDTDALPVVREEFDRFRRHWEGHDHDPGAEQTDRKIDKRIDHRHHVIDALVIAMTSRGLYQKMARHWKAERDAGRKPNLSVSPPMRNLREQALELIRKCNLTHKPDHYPAGRFFQETAYRRVSMENGKTRLVVRTALAALVDNKTSLDKARKAIGDIVSEEVRKIVAEEFEKRVARGMSPQEALATPIPYPRYQNRKSSHNVTIRKVRVYQRMGRGYADGEDIIPIIHVQRDGKELHKYYLSDGYAYVSLKFDNGKIVSAESVPLHIAPRRSVLPAYSETRYYTNDTFLDTSTNRRYVVRQIRAKAALALSLASEAREVRDMDADGGLMLVSGNGLLRLAPV